MTANRGYRLELNKNTAKIFANGNAIGSLKAGQETHFFGVDNRLLGKYQRPSLAPRLSASRKTFLVPDYFKPSYTPVEIDGREVAFFNKNMILHLHTQFLVEPVPPLYQNLATDLRTEDIDWLMALLGYEIYARVNRHLQESDRY